MRRHQLPVVTRSYWNSSRQREKWLYGNLSNGIHFVWKQPVHSSVAMKKEHFQLLNLPTMNWSYSQEFAQEAAVIPSLRENHPRSTCWGFIKKVPRRSRETPKGCNYIPYFAVHNESETTSIRSSCKTRNVSSLNDCLIIVPPIENKILLRLRIHRIVFSTGTEKAFHWVLLGLPRLCTLFMA